MSKVVLLAFTALFIFSSCTKNNPIVQDEIGFRMAVNESIIQTDAVASYCQVDGAEFLIVANKVEHLTFPLETQNFEANDFVYFKSITDEASWSFGGQALDENITGFPGLSILFSGSEMKIESNDGEMVSGSAVGALTTMDENNNFAEFPYVFQFVAEIVQESDFCNQLDIKAPNNFTELK